MDTIDVNQQSLKIVLMIKKFFEDVFTEISERKFLVSTNQFIQIPYPHEKNSSFEEEEGVIRLFLDSLKRMYEHPDDAQTEVKHLKSFKNSTNSQ